MKNYLHVETYYSDESCGIKNIYEPADVDKGDKCESLFVGITHITEEYYSQITDLVAGLLQQEGTEGKHIDTMLVFAICEVRQACMWCVSIRRSKENNNQYRIKVLNMDNQNEDETCAVEYVKQVGI